MKRWTSAGMGLAWALAAGCAAPQAAQFTDADWVSHSTTGRGGYERGDFRRGADAYARAQQRARALDDADALAVAAVNRAVCLLAAGDAKEALAAVDEAAADPRVAPLRRAELLATGARTCAALGDSEAALARAAAALELAPPPATQAQALLAQSAAWLAKGDHQKALEPLNKGLPSKQWSRLPALVRAERQQLAAQAFGLDPVAAGSWAYDDAAKAWKMAGRLPEMARALAEAGREAKAVGDLAGACDRFYRAARSLWAQGLRPEAVRVLEEGVACAEELKDDVAGKRLADLFVTFKNGERLEK